MMFKVGDKVRITNKTIETRHNGKIGIISKVDFDDPVIPYRVVYGVNVEDFAWCAPNHIELVTETLVEATKDTNPKDPLGTRKWRQYCTVPMTAIWELGVAMLEGARKYGRHNYRVAGIRASVYVDAAKGHIDQYWEGEDIDPDSKLHHVTKAIASLVVLRDAQINGMCTDDRPPKANLDGLRTSLQEAVDELFEKYPECVPPYTEEDKNVAPN